MLDAEEHTLGEHIEGVVPVFDGRFRQRTDGATDTGVVEDDVHATERFARTTDHRFDVGFPGDIGADEPHRIRIPGTRRFGHRVFTRGRVEVGDHHLRPFGEKAQHRRAAHAARAARDHGDPVL